MKKFFLSLCSILVVILLTSCSSKSEKDTIEAASQTEAASTVAATEEEIADGGDDDIVKLYYNEKLYQSSSCEYVYDGELSEFYYSLLDGYDFVGLTVEPCGDGETPNKQFSSNYFEAGLPILYNDESDDFIIWKQEDNYWVTVSKYFAHYEDLDDWSSEESELSE